MDRTNAVLPLSAFLIRGAVARLGDDREPVFGGEASAARRSTTPPAKKVRRGGVKTGSVDLLSFLRAVSLFERLVFR